MLNCDFTINVNGFQKSFNSQQELDDFLSKNYTRVEAATEIGNVSFSKDTDPKADTLSKIDTIKLHNREVTVKFDEYGNKVDSSRITGVDYKGVSRIIDDLTVDGKPNGRKIIVPFNRVDYVRNNKERIKDEMKGQEQYKNMTDQELEAIATKEINDRMNGWKVLSKMGTQLHDIAQLFFNENITDTDKLLNRYGKPLDRELMEKYISYLAETKAEMIKRSNDPDMTFIAELPIHDENTKTVGIIDLVGIDKDGNAYLGDFKTSSKSVDDWDRSKTQRTTYQLAFYQQLMMSKNIPVNEMFVFPIYLTDVNIKDNSVGNITREESIPLKERLYSDQRGILENVRNLLPVDISKFLRFKNDPGMASQIQNMFDITIGFDKIDEQLPNFFKNKVKEEDGQKYFYDDITRKKVKLIGTTLEQEDIARAYLQSTIESVGVLAFNRSVALQSMISSKGYEDLVTTGAKDRQILMRKAYSRYTDGTWEIQTIPALASQGILAFRNKFKGTVEFVIDSNMALKVKKDLKFGNNLLGQFYKNSDVEKSSIPLLDANEANIAALKVLMFVNANHETFNAAGSTLGLIRVLNTSTHNLDLVGIDTDDLLANYKELTRKTKVDWNLDKIRRASFEDLLYSQVVHILQNQNVDRDELSLMESIKEKFAVENTQDRIAALIEIQKKWMDKKGIQDQNIDLDSTSGYAFALLNATIVDLQGIKPGFEEDINKVSLNRSEILSTPLELEAIETIRAAQFPIKQAMQAMSDNYIKFNGEMRKIFQEYYRYKGVNMLIGDHLNAFDNLFERDSKGKVTKDFKFKNPFETSSKLDNKERVFLKTILKQINERLRPGRTEQDLINTGDYFDVPLVRAGMISRIHNGSMLDAVKHEYDNVLNFHNLFKEDQQENKRKFEQMLEAHNSFNFSANPDVRERLLTDYSTNDFETNVESILGQLVFADMRKRAYDKILPTVYAVRMTSKLMNAGLLNNPLDNMDRYIKEYVKIAVFDEKILEPAHEAIAKPLMNVKQLVTMGQLAFTPLNLIKETMQGQWNNMSKLLAGQYGEKGATLKSYQKALGYILGESGDFVHNVTMTEELNHLYGVANMDRHQLADKMKLSKQGLTNFQSRWMLWASGAPDYINRMALFVAQMIEDGSFDAHTMKDGILTYDWKKDKRFSEYAKGNKNSSQYNAQRSLYLRVLQEHNNDATALGGVQLIEGDALPRGYTTKEQQSLKMFSDYVHGPYDHEGKIKLNHMLLGGFFLQFKTWLTAKKQQYTMATDKYAIGQWEHSKDIDGNLEYLKTDIDGNTIITIEPTDVQHVVWKGRMMEGVFQSIMRTYGEFKKSQYSVKDLVDFLKQDETIKGNFKMMGFDLAIFAIFALMIKGIIDWDELSKDEPFMAAILRAGVNSTSDLNPWANVKTALDPKALTATISTITQSTEDVMGAMVGDVGFKKVVRNFGVGRTVTDILPPSE